MLGQNLRFLFWREGVPRDAWAAEAAKAAGFRQPEAQELLFSDTASLEVVEALAGRFAVSPEEMLQSDLTQDSGCNVLRENLKYLLAERGAKKHIAESLGVQPMTVSKWLSGTTTPNSSNIRSIAGYFGFSASVNLATDRLFLDPTPASSQQQRRWLIERIEQIDASELREYFPVLQKLLA
jgi:transcriptional regulator with XRE-family HTH domain